MKVRTLTVVGLNSGTSMDGVDAAIFKISPKDDKQAQVEDAVFPKLRIEMLEAELFEFDPSLRREMKSLIARGDATLEDVCRLDAALGEAFADASNSVIRKSGITKENIDLIGSHGQTIWHAPQSKKFGGVACSNTLQLGQSAIIAERTGISVVSDFRVQDMAAGGQGAPLVAFADEILFGELGQGVGILNIGGISNLTVLSNSGEAVMAFDTGPGNMLVDRCTERMFFTQFDRGGENALKGKVQEQWLKEMLGLPYFSATPPKTTGRELFGNMFADHLIDRGLEKGYSKEDITATVSALTSASIAQQYTAFVREKTKISKLILGGGGEQNEFIKRELIARWPDPVELARHEDFGISTKFKESLLFALLAYTNYFGLPNNVPACTGARRKVCLGKLTRA
ncbi:MAG: anhydro-N-acetylmuramic acid kinase [Candidatus Obscuribacterales bacterium]|nr:anhydro-N-acetylmuramic acid kinase [Candidatus Obscuribacterales bacterium]